MLSKNIIQLNYFIWEEYSETNDPYLFPRKQQQIDLYLFQ